MYAHDDLAELGRLAHLAKEARFGKKAFFNHNVHINPTNVCALACRFCAFRRSKRQDGRLRVQHRGVRRIWHATLTT